jgi:dihydroorotase-like cyclic amidohydrolase
VTDPVDLRVAEWMSQGPARLVGLHNKGGIKAGNDADFRPFAPEEPFVVDPSKLCHRNPGTPYEGQRLFAVVRSTVCAVSLRVVRWPAASSSHAELSIWG